MKITKEQALMLLLALNDLASYKDASEREDNEFSYSWSEVEDFVGSVKEFLVDDNDPTEEDSSEDEEPESTDEEDEDDFEEDDVEDESDEEDVEDDSDEEDSYEEEQVTCADIDGLLNLPTLRCVIKSASVGTSGDHVSLSFEENYSGLQVSVDGAADGAIEDVLYVKRLGKQLHVATETNGVKIWNYFDVAKFPAPWVKELKVNQLYAVGEE
jgi:hypothetical protein